MNSNVNAFRIGPLQGSGDPYQVQSIDRAVAILELLGESDSALSLGEICHRVSMHKSTVHRSLMVLEKNALIERTQENSFRLGLKLYELGNRALEQIDLTARIHPLLRRFSDYIGETIHLSVLQKTSILYLDKVNPSRGVCAGSKKGSSNPIYCTAMGKAMLAFQTPEATEEIIRNIKFVRFTAKTLCSKEELMKAIERVRRRGYAVDDEEHEVGVRCIGAPVFDGHRHPIAAISVSGLASEVSAQNAREISETLMQSCGEITASLRAHAKQKPAIISQALRK